MLNGCAEGGIKTHLSSAWIDPDTTLESDTVRLEPLSLGKGNLNALFEALELEQERRGNL